MAAITLVLEFAAIFPGTLSMSISYRMLTLFINKAIIIITLMADLGLIQKHYSPPLENHISATGILSVHKYPFLNGHSQRCSIPYFS